MPNNFADIPGSIPDEICQSLISARHIRVERIVSRSHASPQDHWYDQEQHEWVLLLKGAARLRFEERLVEMRPGDYHCIAAREKHRVEWTTPDEPTIWLTIFYD
jgi:cupin 2 domain-containing protein